MVHVCSRAGGTRVTHPSGAQARLWAGSDTSAEAESLILVDEADREVGYLSKARCHDGRGVLHRAFSLLIFNDRGELLLQRRSGAKTLWPHYWSNSCCSHPRRFESMEEAKEFARSVTNGQGADKALVTVGVTTGGHIAEAFGAIGKSGTVIVTGLGDLTEVGIPVSLAELTLFAKEIRGALFGDQNPSADILKMLRLYQEGHLKLDELVTTRYKLEDINQGYEDMHAGKNIRGVLIYD